MGDHVNALEKINAVDAGYRGSSERLGVARVRRRVGDLKADVRALHAAGKWIAVIAAYAELGKLDQTATDQTATDLAGLSPTRKPG